MRPEWLFVPGLVAILLLACWCGVRLRAEYRTCRELSLTTVAIVWTLYSIHLALVVLAAANSVWALPLAQWLSIPGGLLVLGGTLTYLAAALSFRSLRRMSGMDASRLVTGGIYRWSRNPQNVGWTLVLVGVGLLSASGMVLLLAALFWIGFRAYLPLEERFLERLHGEEYRAYRSHSHRYFGLPGAKDATRAA